MKRITRKQVGRPADFDGFDGVKYNGRIVKVVRRIVVLVYWVTGVGEVTAYIGPENHSRLLVY